MAVTMGVALLIPESGTDGASRPTTSWSTRSGRAGRSRWASLPYSLPHAIAAAASVTLIGALYFLMRFTDLGLMMRAVSQSPEGAALSGINLHRVSLWGDHHRHRNTWASLGLCSRQCFT